MTSIAGILKVTLLYVCLTRPNNPHLFEHNSYHVSSGALLSLMQDAKISSGATKKVVIKKKASVSSFVEKVSYEKTEKKLAVLPVAFNKTTDNRCVCISEFYLFVMDIRLSHHIACMSQDAPGGAVPRSDSQHYGGR